MPGTPLAIDGHALTLEDVARVAHGEVTDVVLAPRAREALAAARRVVEAHIAADQRVYGVTTGFGRLAEVVIPPGQRVALQRNVIVSHASGFGAPMPREVVRALLLLRANTLAHGHSGCSPRCVELLLDFLGRGIHPVVPEFGSVGASGDLVPLAHIALGLMGEGEVEVGGAVVPAARALAEAGLAPLEVREKDGISLINGTQFCSAIGTLALLEAEHGLAALEVAGALSLDALKGSDGPFAEPIQAVRAHPGQVASAARLGRLAARTPARAQGRREGRRCRGSASGRSAAR